MMNCKSFIMEKWKESVQEYQCMIKPCLMMFTVYIVGISAILRANFNYRDDLRRAFNGSKNWESSGRYLSNFLSSFIHADSYLADVSPLPQLIAAFIMAISAVIVWYAISEKKKFSFWDLAALVPLGLSPYFLECFSYKYDAPYMALSVLVSVIPILFWKCKNWVYFTIVGISSFIMCLTYQASSGVFPMLIILFCLKRWHIKEKLEKILRFASYSAGGYFIGMLLYELFFRPQKNSYVSTSLPEFHDIIPVTIKNFAKYFREMGTDFETEWLNLIILLGIGFLFVMIRDTKRKWYTAFIISVLALFGMLGCSFGVYPILSKSLFQPRAMYGIGVFLTFLGISVSTAKKVYPAKIVCFGLAWCFFVFSFTYGNALREQQDYANFRIVMVVNDLNSLDDMTINEEKKMQLDGSIGYAPVVKNMLKSHNMIKRLVPTQFKQGWRTEEWKFFHYYGFKKVTWNWPKKSGVDFRSENLPVLKDTMYHTIRGKNGHILVELK